MQVRDVVRRCTLGPPMAACAGLLLVLLQSVLSAGTDHSPSLLGTYTAGPGIMNHPIGVIPSSAVAVPAGWPLDRRGAVTCLTCHTDIVSRSVPGEPNLRGSESQFGGSPEFCANCHRKVAKGSGKSTHWMGLEAAHILSDASESRVGGSALDEQTRRCLSCHDGVSAPESANNTPWNGTGGYSDDKRRNHPVGMRYDDPSRPKNLSRLRPASLLPREVALPDGKVGCVSCHNLYAGQQYLLTVPIGGSDLCLTCHDMR